MRDATAALWAEQDRHPGDRRRLFGAVAEVVDARSVLYPGSWCDVAASFVWPSVTYVDTDRRAARFFDDADGVREIIAANADAELDPRFQFLHADYMDDLPLEAGAFDLLVSLYAGPVSRHCTVHLRLGGTLLANASHGDVELAARDPRYELLGVVHRRGTRYRVTGTDLDTYLVPKRPVAITDERGDGAGRGIAYTRSADAYLFRRVL